jgi:hypothetical protein
VIYCIREVIEFLTSIPELLIALCYEVCLGLCVIIEILRKPLKDFILEVLRQVCDNESISNQGMMCKVAVDFQDSEF